MTFLYQLTPCLQRPNHTLSVGRQVREGRGARNRSSQQQASLMATAAGGLLYTQESHPTLCKCDSNFSTADT